MEIVRIAAKRYLLHLFVLVLFCATAAWSQETTGTLLGTVTDATGATISNAKVTITNTEKNQVLRTLNTNQSGAFNAPNLAVGTYTVQIEAPGFKTQSYKNIVLNVNDERALKAQLQPGGVSESVQVQADALEVETQNATAQGLISGTQIRELSLKSRNYEELVALMPGVTSDISDTLYVGVSAPSGGTNEVGFSINGSLESQNNWTVDGADNVDRGGNFTLLNYPSVDAISEFKVLRGNYNPEYGRGAGGQINLITRSGTSQFHGSAYEFFRNDALDANTWLNKRTDPIVPKNQLRYNDFGWTLGGPVFIPKVYNTEKNKTFFFYSEELRRVREEQSALSFVPNAAERGFSTNGIPTFADAVCVDYPNCNVISNTIPTSAINPAAAAYLKDVYSKIPLPQDPINHSLVAPGTNTFNYRQEIIRLDHYQNEKWNFMFRYMNDNIPTIETGGLFNGNSIPNITQTNTNSPGRNYIGKVTYLPSPTLINEIAYAYSYGAVTSDNTGVLPFSASPDVASAIALPFPNQLQRIPNISFANGTGFAGFGNYRDFNRNHNVFDNLTKVAGNHTLKFGFSYNAYQKSENAAGNNVGSFSFSQGTSFVPCCDTDPNNAGNPSAAQNFEQEWANFLTGNADNFSQLGSDFHAEIRQKQFEFYGQDTYRFRPNLTFNYGLRYSLFLQPTDANNQSTSFDPGVFNPANAATIDLNGNLCTVAAAAQCVGATPNPNFDPNNGIIIGNVNSPFGKAVAPTSKLLFQPRIGVAWDPSGSGKTSLRAGYGVFVESPGVNYVENPEFGNPPFVQNLVINSTLLNDPLAEQAVNNAVPSIAGVATKWHQPYVQQYNFDIQQQMPSNIVFDIGYYGSKGTHLLAAEDINQPIPGAYATSPIVQAAFAANGVDPGSQLTSDTSQLINGIRPFPGWGSIDIYVPEFKSNYNSLQTSLQKRFAGGSLVAVNYTWSKSLTNEPNDPNFTVPQNTFDIASEYGPTRFDRRHVFTADFVYEIPWLRNQAGFLGHVLGGWELSGVVNIQSGAWLTAGTASNNDPGGVAASANSFGNALRPDQIADANAGAAHTADQWFNTAAFVDVPDGQFRVGNARRASILGPGQQRWDLSLFKNFKFTERTSLQFRTEAFNVFNHTNFAGVGTTLGAEDFGTITSAHDPRILQLGLKLNF